MVKKQNKMFLLMVLLLEFAGFWVNTSEAMRHLLDLDKVCKIFCQDENFRRITYISNSELIPKDEQTSCFGRLMKILSDEYRDLREDLFIYNTRSKDQRWKFSPILSQFITNKLKQSHFHFEKWLNGISSEKFYHDIVSTGVPQKSERSDLV